MDACKDVIRIVDVSSLREHGVATFTFAISCHVMMATFNSKLESLQLQMPDILPSSCDYNLFR